jgi:hypothetical protein
MNDLKVTVKRVAAHLGRELKEAEIKSVTSPLLRQSDSRTESLVSRYTGTGPLFNIDEFKLSTIKSRPHSRH